MADEAYEANACTKWYENAARTAGTEGHITKLEELVRLTWKIEGLNVKINTPN
jgi:hypothetical protein